MLAGATAADVTVVFAELAELSGGAGGRDRRSSKGAAAADVEVLGLVAALRRATGSPRPVYRVGDERFALLLPRTNRLRAGELMLLATCGAGPAFHWGAGSLSSAGKRAADDPGVLMMLAEADLLIRRRDLSHARALLTRRRRASVATSAAAALALVGGSAFGLDAFGGGAPLRAALEAHGHGSASAHVLGPGASPRAVAPPPSVPTSVTPAVTAAPVAAPVPAVPVARPTSAAPVALVSVQTPPPQPNAATPTPTPTPTVPATTAPPAPSSPVKKLLDDVTELLHQAKHAVPWNKGHHESRF